MTMALAGVASAHAENKAADAAYNWRRRMEELGTSNAVLANAAKQRQLGTQTQQKLRSVGDEIRMIARKGNQAAATAAVRATKGGLAADSGSVERLQAQFGRDALESIGVRELEGAGTRTFSQQQAEAIELETQARINSVQAGPAPSKFGQFTNLVIGGVSGYMDGMEPSSGIVQEASAAVPEMSTHNYFQDWAASAFSNLFSGPSHPMGADSRFYPMGPLSIQQPDQFGAAAPRY